MARVGVPDHRFHGWLTESSQFLTDWQERNQLNFEYYDGTQWTEEETKIIEERGQQASVLNAIRPTVDMIIALEAQRRTDIQVIGREESDDQMADLMTKLMKQVYDQNDYNFRQGKIFREGVVGGAGWLQISVQEDESEQNQIVCRRVPWEEVYWDPFMREPDGSDARYIIRRVWIDRDRASELWGKEKIDGLVDHAEDTEIDSDYEGQEDEAQDNADTFRFNQKDRDTRSRRIAVNETWYKDAKGRVRYCQWSGKVYLKGSDNDEDNPSPYRMNMYPLIPFFASINNVGKPQGVVDWCRPMQDSLNKNFSKWQWTVAARQAMYEVGAVEDPEELRAQIAKPDGVIPIESGFWGKVQALDAANKNESVHLMQMMSFLLQMIQRVSGVNDALLGLGGVNARSAEQENNRSLSGAQMQTSFLENLFFSKKRSAEVILQLMGEFYTDRRVIRITAPNGTVERMAVNNEGLDEFNEPIIENQVIMENVMRYDVKVEQVPAFSSTKQLMLRYITDMSQTGALPAPIASKMFLVLSDMPDKAELIQEVEQYFQEQAQLQQQEAAAAGPA